MSTHWEIWKPKPRSTLWLKTHQRWRSRKKGDTLIDWKDKALTHKLADTKWSM